MANRRMMFEALVLQGLWVIILCVIGQKGNAIRSGQNFQSSAIAYMDEHGLQHDGAKQYRREITFAGQMM